MVSNMETAMEPDGSAEREAEAMERYDADMLQIELDEAYADEQRDDPEGWT